MSLPWADDSVKCMKFQMVSVWLLNNENQNKNYIWFMRKSLPYDVTSTQKVSSAILNIIWKWQVYSESGA